MFVVGLTGYTCSGKSEFAQLLERKGFHRINLGDFTREAAERQGRPLRRDQSWELFKEMIARDPAWRLPRVLEALRRLSHGRAVVDGIRTREEAEGLARALGADFLLVEVRVPEELRLRRARSRRREVDVDTSDPVGLARWQTMDREEVELVDRIRPLVDAVVEGGDVT